MHINHRKFHTVLIVEDDPNTATLLALLVGDLGYSYLISNPADVYNLVPGRFFSLAIVNLNMPAIDGFEVLDYIKSKCPEIPVVMLTGEDSGRKAVKALKKGAVDYITKPFGKEITETIDQIITEAKKERRTKGKKNQQHHKIVESGIKTLTLRLKKIVDDDFPDAIVKSIDFDEESYQAGISILSYFSTIVKQRYPDTKVKIRIEQEGQTVRLVVELPNGEKEKIERTLEDYGLVVLGQKSPEELLPDPLQVMQLRYQLDQSALQITHFRELLQYAKDSHHREISGLKEEVSHLRLQISEAFKRESRTHDVLAKVIEVHSLDGAAKTAMTELSARLEVGIAERDKEIILGLMSIIQQQNTPAFEDLKTYIISSLGGASGNLLSTWLPALVAALPK